MNYKHSDNRLKSENEMAEVNSFKFQMKWNKRHDTRPDTHREGEREAARTHKRSSQRITHIE